MDNLKTEIEKQIIQGAAFRLAEAQACRKVDTRLLRLRKERAELTAEIDARIEKAELERARLAAQYTSSLVEVESGLWEMVRQLGEPVITDNCKVSYKNNGVQRSWKLDALDALEEEAPEVWAAINPYRTEKEKTPTIKIEWL